jgi:hypothetical protein
MIFHDHGLRSKFPALVYAIDSWDELNWEVAELNRQLHDARLAARETQLVADSMPLVVTCCLCAGVSLGLFVGRLLS